METKHETPNFSIFLISPFGISIYDLWNKWVLAWWYRSHTLVALLLTVTWKDRPIKTSFQNSLLENINSRGAAENLFQYSITELPLLLAPRLLEFYPVITKLPLPFPANINSSILILLRVKIKSISLSYPGQRIQILWVNQLKFFFYYY